MFLQIADNLFQRKIFSGLRTLSCALLLVVTAMTAQAQSWAVRMAESDMARNPRASLLDFVKDPRWNYTNGLVCSAVEQVWEKTGDEKFLNYIKAYADEMIGEDSAIKGYKPQDYNIDKVNAGKFLFPLYEKTHDERYVKAIKDLREQMRTQPRTSEGGFWHKKIYPHQMWLDGIYMGSPFLAQYAKVFNEPALFDEVALQIALADQHTYDASKGLWYHAWDESREQKWADKQTGKSPNVWGRAMGWYAMALVDVLDFFPADHRKRKMILEVMGRMAQSLVRYQDATTGLWYQVVDQGGREGNYLEASASVMYDYFLVKAVKKGYIDKKYLANAQKAFAGILSRFIKTNNDGSISITDVCAVAGLGGDPYRDGSYDYYIHEPRRDNDPKAVGPFIMLALQCEDMNIKP
jgi:unsaturated rhamnogalacturonyl hydrolase